jgi:curved DNA-binding protein CbpA
MDPYQVLQLPSGADSEAVRRAYLSLIKTHTPESDPEAFTRIREAFEALNDPMRRMQDQLFSPSDFEDLHRFAESVPMTHRRLPASTILDLGRTYDRTS